MLENPTTARPEVAAVLENEGLYFLGDTQDPRGIAPILSYKGRIYQLAMDGELVPHRFSPTAVFHGPLRPPSI
jgi:hypothetical protein